jgi:hypothetical protein
MAADTRRGETFRKHDDLAAAVNQRGGRTAHRSELVHELARQELLALADSGDAPLVSIYLSIPHVASLAAQRIAWSNLVRAAERQLVGERFGGAEVRRVLTPARGAVESRNTKARGLAYFASVRSSRALSVAIDVPTTVVVGDRCYLRPLLPLLEQRDDYFVLGLGRDDVRLFAGTRELVKELSLEGLPLAPLATMPRERRPAGACLGDRGSTDIRGMWHGVGGTADEVEKRRIIDHFRGVDAALKKILRNSDVPLVLGGVGYLHALYRGVNSYSALVPEGITAGLGDMTMTQLHDRTWPMVEPTLHARPSEALARFRQLHGSGRTVSEPSAAARAADAGRVGTLIVAAAETDHIPGADVASAPTDDTHAQMLLEQAIAGTLRHGGSIHVVDGHSMPTSTSLAGLLRY